MILFILTAVLCLSSLAQVTDNQNLKVLWKCDVSEHNWQFLSLKQTGLDNSVAFITRQPDGLFWVRNDGAEILRIQSDVNSPKVLLKVSNDLLAFTESKSGLIEYMVEDGSLEKTVTAIGIPYGNWGQNDTQPVKKFLARLNNELILYEYENTSIQQIPIKEPAAFNVEKTAFATEAGKNYVEFNATVTPNQTYSWSFSDDLKSWTALGELSSEDGNLWLRVENKQGNEYIKLK